ncbi:MAG TPA: SDR family NAD(P)-dependent oxidoreductase [Candidatus Cybelea sp.]|nr:SDR family NAD(P)-dependent oxidoreductase [Candidatus Cybelea sp.]
MAFRSALVTGASSGIGEAFARGLPRTTVLLLAGRDRDRLTRLAHELGSPERMVRIAAGDLATEEGRQGVISAAESAEVDLVVNNAGIGRLGKVTDNSAERESEMVLVNALAPVEICRALLPGMLRRAETSQSRAGIINVSSAAAFTPMPFFATYAASKAFLLHYTEALAEELSDKPIDVLALCPGATRTRFFERAGVNEIGFSMHDPGRVVREALQALGHRTVHIVGPGNYLATAAIRFLPRRFVTAAVETVTRKWR